MVKPSNHCPHLGLKQNRAIRFASPTPEHRCYVTGEAQEIPVDQSSFCLCPEHINCPLYTGLSMSSTAISDKMSSDAAETSGGVRGWIKSLSMRDRLIYGSLLSVMLIIMGMYIVLAVQLLFGDSSADASPALPEPTATATVAGIIAPSATPEPSPLPELEMTATETAIATDTPEPTPTVAPTAPPLETQTSVLYFSDPSNRLLVPVSREIDAQPDQRAEVLLTALFAGPQPGSRLNSVVPADLQVLGVSQSDSTVTVNFGSEPDRRVLEVVALTLTESPGIERVEFEVNGAPVTLENETNALRRVPFNVDNPQGLPEAFDSRETSFLPLYFQSDNADGQFVRVTRLVPRTTSPARATVEELLAGPGSYDNLLNSPVPAGTTLNSIMWDDQQQKILAVDLSQEFAGALDRQDALDALLLSLTELRTGGERAVNAVEVSVEGEPLVDVWGPQYGGPFERPPLNAE